MHCILVNYSLCRAKLARAAVRHTGGYSVQWHGRHQVAGQETKHGKPAGQGAAISGTSMPSVSHPLPSVPHPLPSAQTPHCTLPLHWVCRWEKGGGGAKARPGGCKGTAPGDGPPGALWQRVSSAGEVGGPRVLSTELRCAELSPACRLETLGSPATTQSI